MSRENQNLYSNKDYSDLIRALRGEGADIHQFTFERDSPSFNRQLFAFAKRLATERDENLAINAAQLLLMVQRRSGDNIDLQDEVRHVYQAVVARLPNNDSALRIAVPLSICRSIEEYEGASADNQGLISDCGRTIKAELKNAGEKCVRDAKAGMRDPDSSNKNIEFYCNLFVIYAAPLPSDSPRMSLFIDSYQQTTKQLQALHLDAAVLLDLPLASRLPQELELTQIVLGNLSRRMNALISNLDHTKEPEQRREVLSEFLELALSEFPHTNPTYIAIIEGAQQSLAGKSAKRMDTQHFSDYLAPQP